MKKYLMIMSTVILSLHAVNCDTTSADPYKAKYEEQVAFNAQLQTTITDLQQLMQQLGARMDSIHTASINKIDSLRAVVAQKDSVINFYNENTNIMLQSIQDGLENLQADALQYLISIQKR